MQRYISSFVYTHIVYTFFTNIYTIQNTAYVYIRNICGIKVIILRGWLLTVLAYGPPLPHCISCLVRWYLPSTYVCMMYMYQ